MWILRLKELQSPAALQTVRVDLTPPTKLLRKINAVTVRSAAAATKFTSLGWSINMLRQQWQMSWSMRQILHRQTLKWHRSTAVFTTVQHVLRDHIPTMCTPRLGAIHSSRQHSWSMLTVAASRGMLTDIFTSLTNRLRHDQWLLWQHIPRRSCCDLSSHNTCNNIR